MQSSSNPTNSTISSLQTYITQLTLYINQNNQKYTRNLQTLKQFYQQQINTLNDNIIQLQEQLLKNKNQIVTLKDLLQNRNIEIGGLKDKVIEIKQENEEIGYKLKNQRQRNQQLYKSMDLLRDSLRAQIDKQIQKYRIIQQQKSKLLIIIKQKQSQLRTLKTQSSNLQQKLAQRYTMPQRMKQLQIQSTKDRQTILHLNKKITQLTKQSDFSQMQLQRKRKQNQKLTIQANKAKGDLTYQIEKVLKKQRIRYTQQIQTLKLQNQRKIYQIKDLQLKLKQKIQLSQKLQNVSIKIQQSNTKLQIQIKQLKDDKHIYLEQFRKLKGQYEIIINNLQNAIPEYQKKNWVLEQENQELNTQLDGLQQLLRQVRAMNDMEPVRKQYRQWAQLNLAVDKKLPQQQNTKNTYQKQRQRQRQQSNYLKRQNQTDISPDWDKLMQQIQKIQI